MKSSMYRSKPVWAAIVFVGIAVSGCGRLPARDEMRKEVARLEAHHRETSLPGLTVTGVTASFTRGRDVARDHPTILVEIVQESESSKMDGQEKRFTLTYNYALTYWDAAWEPSVYEEEMDRRLQQAIPVVEWDVSKAGSPFSFGGSVCYEPASSRTRIYPRSQALPAKGEIEVHGKKMTYTSITDMEDQVAPFACTYRFIFDDGDWTYVSSTPLGPMSRIDYPSTWR